MDQDHPHIGPSHEQDGHSRTPPGPHPAQVAAQVAAYVAPWSILRMTLRSRLGVAVALSAGLWVIVLLAMR